MPLLERHISETGFHEIGRRRIFLQTSMVRRKHNQSQERRQRFGSASNSRSCCWNSVGRGRLPSVPCRGRRLFCWVFKGSGVRRARYAWECAAPQRLREAILDALSDAPRPGAPAKFTTEQVSQIVAVACEPPDLSGRPINHWTVRELRDEVLARKIVETISRAQVGRILQSAALQTIERIAVQLSDIVWMYHFKQTESFAVLCLRTGKSIPMPLKGEQVDKLLREVSQRVPWALYGYDLETLKMWRKKPADVVALSDEQRRQHVGES